MDLRLKIEPAVEEDIGEVRALLEVNRLPLDGLDAHLETLLVGRLDGRVVGSAGLEIHGPFALLRSVAVLPAMQGLGVGAAMTDAALDAAVRLGIQSVFLLTTTAERFFPRFGFETVSREAVPSEVQQSVEFTTACPASAVVMRKALTGVSA